VIISTGGCASSDLGSDGSGYRIAKQLGHHINELVPALTALRSNADYFKALAGVRVEAMIQLFQGDRLLSKETGELQLTNYGVSGIPVFQISRFAGKAINQNKKIPVFAMVDFLPGQTTEEIHKLIVERIKSCSYKTMEEQMIGLFNKKLASVILKLSGIKFHYPSAQMNHQQIEQLVNQIKNFRIAIHEPNPFEQAQVTAGGVVTDEIHATSMESKLIKGLYFTGEIVDVDGTCGGYNLQWAWSSGYLAGKHAALPKEKGRGSKND
jgi:predicted Rossmann fold flavoprotein